MVVGPATEPEMVKVVVPETSYQSALPSIVFVIIAPGDVAVTVRLESKSLISILVAPPPKENVIGSIGSPIHTICSVGSPPICVKVG